MIFWANYVATVRSQQEPVMCIIGINSLGFNLQKQKSASIFNILKRRATRKINLMTPNQVIYRVSRVNNLL